MKIWKTLLLWYIGGMGYTALELLWRGWSHGSMFVLGGLCFLLIGWTERLKLPLLLRTMLCGMTVTGLELLSGLLLNRLLGLAIWDYTGLPGCLMGQICLPYCLLWHLVSLFALGADRWLRRVLFGEMPAHLNAKKLPGTPKSPGSG